jgi:mRNA interferase RelE/StbE
MWIINYRKTFLKELSKLPFEIQSKIENIVFEKLVTNNPFELGFIEKMKGYPDKYKIRIGDYRIGITINSKSKEILCERIAHRKDIYKLFP